MCSSLTGTAGFLSGIFFGALLDNAFLSFLRELEQAMARAATVERNTLETQISVTINLDGTGKSRFDTGVPFLEHMMDQIARHGLIDLDITCKGDNHIDDHHSVEDIGI